VQKNMRHLDRLEAIRFIDGEMSPAQISNVELHVDQCEECRQMLSTVSVGLARLQGVMYGEEQTVHSRETATMRLQAKLADTRSGPVNSARAWLGRFTNGTPLLRYALLFAIVALGIAGLSRGDRMGKASNMKTILELPDRSLTPGVARLVDLTDICKAESDEEDLDPAVPSAMQKKVFYEYGVSSDRQGQDFQVDYLINPQLGGTNDIHNLWPQPYNSAEWNAKAKDALERHLHQMVCERKLDLAEAQRDISTNWIAAYQKYFHTARPV
jgi:hypothetical protein